jgi:hypothetical protein
MRTRYGIKIFVDDNCPANNYVEYDTCDCDFCADCGEADPDFLSMGKMVCASCALKRHKVNEDTVPCAECGYTDADDICYKEGGEVVCGECLLIRLQ